jgi:hypothetical protein
MLSNSELNLQLQSNQVHLLNTHSDCQQHEIIMIMFTTIYIIIMAASVEGVTANVNVDGGGHLDV